MRADRLLSLLMLLQQRGCMTAAELSDELEVSERTVYRDVEALCYAGVPVYTEHGPGGGFSLVDSYRTELTGLTTHELQALFAVSIPAPLAALGLRQDFQSALLKLTSALPTSHRKEEERIRGRIHLDWEGWSGLRRPTPYLNVVYQALFTDRQVLIRFPMHFGAIGEKTVHPLGLVTKDGAWHLVCLQNELVKVHLISDLLYAEIQPETCLRPEGFRLENFWQEYCRRAEENRSYYAVTVRIPADQLPDLERVTRQHVERIDQPPGDVQDGNLITVRLAFFSLGHARSRLIVFGGALEVLEPRALRLSMADYAEQILRKYRPTQVV